MVLIDNPRTLRTIGVILGALVWLANSGNPSNGRTGAPFDGHCNNCHGGSNPNGYNGDIEISGLPGTIEANTAYPLTITMTPTAGSPSRGGFQLVAVSAGNNANAGDLTAANSQSGTENSGGREYLEHRNPKNFGGGPISWDFTWTSPGSANGNAVTFYFIGNFCNGSGSGGDFPKATSLTVPFNGPPAVTASISSTTNVSCFGGANGSATAEGSGGTPPYTFAWSNGQTTQTAVNLSAGTYTVTVSGSGGSGSATASATITQPTAITLSATSANQINCNQPTSTLTANASGGTPSYTYQWSNGDSGSPIQVTAPGVYTVTLTDNNSCTKTASVTVSGNITQPNAQAAASGALNCTQTTVTVSGAGSSTGANISYLWTTPNGNIVSGANTVNAIVNAPGTYILLVTNTANGCTNTATAEVTSSANPPGAAAGGGVLNCTSPSINLSGSSGTPGVSFAWTGPNGFSSSQQNPAVNAPGVYNLTVTNPANGCTSTASANVTTDINIPVVTTSSSNTLTCTQPTATLSANVNISNAGFSWSGPNGFVSTMQNPQVSEPGLYQVVVTNTVNGCTNSATVTQNQNITAPGAGASSSGAITCTDTLVTITGSSNANPASYFWSGPGGNFSTQVISVNTAGQYGLTVTDPANGCTSTAAALVALNQAPPVAVASAPGNLNCQNATLQLSGAGSSQGAIFTYLWSTANGNIVSGANTLTPVVDAAGLYILQVNNTENGCQSTASVTVLQSSPVVATAVATAQVSCNGGANGSVLASASGGVGALSYLWNTGATTSLVQNLPAGLYLVTVTDAENCSATASAQVNQPSALSVNATASGETAAGANNGSATAAPSGGTPGYSYLWSNGASTQSINNLAPGAYTVTVSDANNCTQVQTVTVNSFNCNLSGAINTVNVSCNGAANGTATVSVNGAINPVVYTWSNGASSAGIQNLTPGTYTVTVMDDAGCTLVLSANITEPPALAANATATQETAAGANNGTASAQPNGGLPPYSYAWNNGANTADIANLAPGTYTVTVTDAGLCTAVQSVSVLAFNCTLNGEISTANVLCAGSATGQATISLSGGTAPFSYLWNNGAQQATITNLVAGTYTVTATDGAACTVVQSTQITELPALQASVSGQLNNPCPESQTGSALIDVSGGAGPYQIQWPGGSGGQNLANGAYTVTVTDANGCSTTTSLNIISTDTLAPGIACPGNIVTCGADLINYSQPTLSDNCSLNGISAQLISGQASGTAFNDGVSTQVFRATDASGNSAECSFTVTVFPLPDVTIDSIINESGNQGNGRIRVTPSGGGGSYQFVWNRNGQFFSNEEDLLNLSAGVYTLTLYDGNGCSTILAPVTVSNTVSAGEPIPAAAIALIPNPVGESFTLQMENRKPSGGMLFNPGGKLLRRFTADELTTEIPANNLPAGMYYLQLFGVDNQTIVLKFIKLE